MKRAGFVVVALFAVALLLDLGVVAADEAQFVERDGVLYVFNVPGAGSWAGSASPQYGALIDEMAERYQVPAKLIAAVIKAESNFNPRISAQGVTPGKPLAEINGQPITDEEIDKPIAAQLSKLQEQIYGLRRQRLESAIKDRLLAQEAAKRGISVQKLLDAEVTSKVTLVTEEEVEKFFEANKAQIKPDADQSEIRDQIRGRLQGQKIAAQREAFIESLRKNAKVAIHLQAPPVQRVEVSINGAPVKGGAKAPVTIVEFSDFHCPFCKRVLPTLKQIEEKYGDKVKIAFRDFPIDQLHPGARKAHEAARCATEQGKFWPYHDLLFESAPRTSGEELTAYAQKVGLDVGKFGQCVTSGKYKEVVQKDIDEGARLGVNGTPAFFINGRPRSSPETAGKSIGDALGVATTSGVLGSTEIATSPEIVDPDATWRSRAEPARFISGVSGRRATSRA